MKVLYLTNIPSPYRVDFFNELGKICDLTVLYERRSASDRDKEWKGSKAGRYNEVYLEGINLTADGSLCVEIIKWLKKDKFDIFVIGGYSTPTGMLAIQTLKMRKIPFILNADGGVVRNDKKFVKKIKRYFISSAKAWLSTGKSTNDYLEHYGADMENIYVYPFTSIKKEDILCESLPMVQKKLLKEELDIQAEKVVLSVGQFIHRKGYDILIDSWKAMDKSYQLLIVGSGPEEEKMKNLIDNNKLRNIKLVSFKSKDELKKYYMCSDLFVLPTREDIWGLVINEAMANALPIITTTKCVAGIELVDINNGAVIDSDNSDILKETMTNLLNSEKLKDMAGKSLSKIEGYTIENMANRHLEIFKKVIYEE